MTKFKKTVMLMLGLLAMTPAANAQDEVEVSVSADVVNQYIWRGQKLGEVSIQPTLGLSYKGLSLTAWGSSELSNMEGDKEFDLTLAYSVGNFNFGITDYWISGNDGRYFMYEAHKTLHVFEANVGYDFGVCSLQWFTNFAGADKRDIKGDRYYSSYVEVSAPFKLGGLDWTATVGAVPFETTFYEKANGFAVTNVSVKATKDLKVTDSFTVPVFAGITANPSTEKAYFLCGFTIQP